MRLRHRPETLLFRGDEFDFHRLQDGPTLACLDRFTDQQQPWLLHSGRVITPTGAEVRDIILQVHEIVVVMPDGSAPAVSAAEPTPVPQTQPIDPVALDAATDEALDDDPGDLFPDALAPAPEPAPDPMGDALERQRIANARLLHKDEDLPAPGAPLSDWEAGEGVGAVEAAAAVSNVPPEIAALLDDGETLTRDIRRKLTERLNVELAELKNLRGLAGEDLKREAEIEKLLGLFARLGEI